MILAATWNGSQWSGFQAERQSFDPWGERRNADTWATQRSQASDPRVTSGADYHRGFTGHEMLDDFGLIHMNGRIYDPEIGRFLSCDPYVQVPEFSQNFNRYTYVLNNPLTYTDPSGNFLPALTKYLAHEAFAKWTSKYPVIGQVASVIVYWVVLAFTQSSSLAGAASGAIQAKLQGGDFSDVVRAAGVGAVTGYLTEGLSTANTFVRVAGQAVVNGAANVAMGGRFQDGFISSLAVSLVGLPPITKADNFLQAAGKLVVAGVVGGTASAVGGGKFANGALTASFQFLVSSYGQSISEKRAVERISKKDYNRGYRTSLSVYDDYVGGKLGEIGIDYKEYFGFGAALYGNNKDGWILAFRGTNVTSIADWAVNILQAFGIPTPQYQMAKDLGKRVYEATGGNVTMVGHSLGGGLASAAAKATGADFITFNSSGLNMLTVISGNHPSGNAYFIKGEILSAGQDASPLPDAIGNRLELIDHGGRGMIGKHMTGAFDGYY